MVVNVPNMSMISLYILTSLCYIVLCENEVSAQSQVDNQQCSIPDPLKYGSYSTHPNRCPVTDISDPCRLVPGSSVSDRWLLFYSCQPDYQLTQQSRASICRGGRWVPPLPSCVQAVNLVKKTDWDSILPQREEFPKQTLPLHRVIIAHTATDGCDSRPDCILLVQSIQEHHTNVFGDIGYNFLVGSDGTVMEGQGWDKIGAHTINYNTGSVCIALIGNFVSKSASVAALEAVQRLIRLGVSTGQLAPNYKLYAHCQLISIASPGRNVFDVVKHWTNWDGRNASRCI